jgi:hypothetical protein
MTTIRDDRIALFAKLQDPASQPQFWDRVADDVDWTVEGTHPHAGRYHDKTQFIEATFNRLAGQAVPGESFTPTQRPRREQTSLMTIAGCAALTETSSSRCEPTWTR